MSCVIIYTPETMTYTLSNGTERMTLPNWAHGVIKDEVAREVRPLKNSIEILSDVLALCRKENKKLRELADLLLWGINNDVPPAEGLVWSQKVNVLMRELGMEED